MQKGKIDIFPNGKKQIELERSAIHYIQGFYYARPMDEAHLEALFRGQLTAV